MNKQKSLEHFIIDNIEDCRLLDGRVSWKKIIELVEEKFPKENTNKERIRSLYRKHFDEKYQKHAYTKHAKEVIGRELMTLEEAIIKRINKKYSIEALAERLDTTVEEVLEVIINLQFKGFAITLWEENNNKYVQFNLKNRQDVEPSEHILDRPVNEQIKIAIFSDAHIGHKQFAKEEMQYFIQEAYQRGVRDMFFVGDLVEGHYMSIRPTSIKELDAIGFDDQIDLANEVLPQLKDLRYHMISGNHDATFSRNAFANPIKTLARERKDISFLGHNFAKIWITNHIDISLVHPTDGIGQNYSLKMRQHIDRAREERLSRFIFMGHYHKFDHTHYSGVDGFIMPAFVKGSHFMDDKNLATVVGGIIMTLNVDKQGKLISFIPEYFFFDD